MLQRYVATKFNQKLYKKAIHLLSKDVRACACSQIWKSNLAKENE